MIEIKNIRFSYFDKTYGVGPCIEIIGTAIVKDLAYSTIVECIQQLYPQSSDIKIISFNE